jgi:hypothetical protein
MDLVAMKRDLLLKELGVDSAALGKTMSIVDFGNVTYWFDKDRQTADNVALAADEKLQIDLDGLKKFADLFTDHTRFYYGHDSQKEGSLRFLSATRAVFGKSRVFTKPIQKVRHHLQAEELVTNTRTIFLDAEGAYVQIPKCNFDVEMTVDAIRLMDSYDTLIIFSGDADFVSLNRFLRRKGKKIIMIKGGHITQALRAETDRVINAQSIKRHISQVKKIQA